MKNFNKFRASLMIIWLTVLVLSLFLGLPSLFSFGEGIAGTLQEVKARGKLIVGVKTDYPPLGFLDKNGVNKGLDIDIAKILAKELLGNEKEAEFVPVTSGNRIATLASGKIDVIVASLTITEERKREVDFSDPYFITAQQILVRGNSKIATYQDLAGQRVATIRGSAGDIAIKELVPSAERIRFERNFEALQALKELRVEAFVQDFILLDALIQKTQGLKVASLRPFRLGRYGLAVRKGDKEWLDFIDATFAKMKETGEYEKLLDKWFGPVARVLWVLLEVEK
jgi:ABC-type amino acid transport substrate-binding protein